MNDNWNLDHSDLIPKPSERAIAASRCYEIQTNLGTKEVHEFETIPEIGMAIQLALHIRGLPLINYDTLKLVAGHYLKIPGLVIERIVRLLAEIEFLRLQTEGTSIKAVLPIVPYYNQLYDRVGEYSEANRTLNEAEQLAVLFVEKLSMAPENSDRLQSMIGAEKKLFQRGVQIGNEGNYLISRRARGKDILISPTYFSENIEIFTDCVAAQGAQSVKTVMETIKKYQGWPLKLIEANSKIGNIDISQSQINLLKRLSQDGAVKPPTIITSYSGENHFIFTPTPGTAALNPTRKPIYEKAMAIVAAIRQGQLLPQRYAIKWPSAVVNTLRRDKKLGKPITEAQQQYKNLVHLKIGQLIDVGNGFSEFRIIDMPENIEALDMACDLISNNTGNDMSIDDDARYALQQTQDYIESTIASARLREREQVVLSDEHEQQLSLALLGGR